MPGEAVVPRNELHEFVVRCLVKAGGKQDHCRVLADLMVAADYGGHYSHGINRLDVYVRLFRAGATLSDKEPEVVKETAATALVNGNNALGAVIGTFCIDKAIEKAKSVGIGWVSAYGSNHFGIAGWYTMRAMEQGLIGLAFSNTPPLMVPTRAKKACLGTNPISCAAPANNGDSLVLDMSTSAVAIGKLELNKRKGLEIPLGWAIDSSGKATKDPAKVTGLMPLGGTEENSGYKGYGLGMMVELLCGILSGANFGMNVPKLQARITDQKEANLGQSFVAIDPSAFAPGFTDRLAELNTTIRGLEPVEGESKVLVPGDSMRYHMARCDTIGGIPYQENQIQFANSLAAELGVDPPKTL